MSTESKRLLLFATAFLIWMASANFILEKLGYLPKPKPKPPVVQVDEQPGAAAKDAKAPPENKEAAADVPAKVEPVKEALVLGDLADTSGYHLRADATACPRGQGQAGFRASGRSPEARRRRCDRWPGSGRR